MVSTRQMERLFARYLGTSPNKYYRQIRLHKARILIEGSKLSLSQVALACGFESHSHFSRVFKNRYGVTPYDVRSRLLHQ
nr:helix-turn-helix domain-containing protein [Defluviimonas salinarum]